MFSPSRDQARSFFFDTWQKYRNGQPLVALERVALDVILLHPEYHAVLDDRAQFQAREYGPEGGEMNPFLHMSLHLAIEEQLSIDQPPGISASYEALAAKVGEHDAKHRMLECLGETVWQAQRTGAAPDQEAYLACIRQA